MEAHETLGDAILELGADWAPLRRELETAGTYTRIKMDEMARSTGQFQRSLDQLGSAMRNFTAGGQQFATVTTATRELTNSFLKLRSATEAYKLAAGSAAATTDDLARKLGDARRQLGLTTTQVELLTKALGLAGEAVHEWNSEIDDMDQGLRDVNASMGEFITLHGRIRALGPMLTPEQRRSITTEPAYQGLMRSQTEAAGPGGPIIARVELPPEMGDRIVEAINTGRRLEALLERQLQTGEYSILGGGTPRYTRTERPKELAPAPEMGPEFFDRMAQEMDKVMAPVRAAWAQGINVQSAAAEASAQAAKEAKDELGGIRSLLAQMGREAAEPEAAGGEDIARLEALRRDITQYMAEPIANAVGDAVKQNLPEGMLTREDIDKIVPSQRYLDMMERFARQGLSMGGNKPGNAVAILGGAKSPETPVNANNPLPTALVSSARSGLGANAANYENEPAPQVQSTAAGVAQAAPTAGTAAQPQQVVHAPTQATPAMTQEDLAARLLERESILARLPAGRVPRTGLTPGQYASLAGREPYYGPQRQLPRGETIGTEPGYVHFEPMYGTRGGPNIRTGQLTPEEYDPFSGQVVTFGHPRPQFQYPVRAPIEPIRSGTTGTPRDVLAYIDSVMGAMASSEIRAAITREIASQADVPRGIAGAAPIPRRRQLRGGQWVGPETGPSRYRWPEQPSREMVPFGPGVPMGREITPHTPETVMRNYGNLLHMFHAYEDIHAQDPGDPHRFAQAAAHLMAWLEALRAADEAMGAAIPALPRGVPPGVGGGGRQALPRGGPQRAIPRQAMRGGSRFRPFQETVVEDVTNVTEIAPGAPGGGDGGRPPPFVFPGQGGWGEFARRALFGRRNRGIPFLGAVPGAGFGLLSLAGLGPEHLLGTAGAIGASAIAGGAGAATLLAGAAGTMAVGGGADLAVLKSTLTDTQALSGSYTQLQNAVQTYGQKSRQAALAQGQLNQQLLTLSGDPKSGKPGVGALAELQLAKSAQSLDQFWDRSTQKARVQAVNIMQQGVTLGRDYTPRIANAANENLKIINQGIKPLFSWLEGPQGVKIFNDLEGMFRRNLPTAVHAFSQAVEILLRFVDAASKHTGHFTETLDKFLTKINERSSGYFTGIVDKLVGDFKVWEKFAKLLVTDLDLIFRQNAGAGKDIITTLDGMLGRLHTWLTTSRGQQQLHSVFETHKQEVLTLLDQLPKLLKAFGSFYLTVSPALTTAFTGFIKLLADVLGPLVTMSPQITTFVGAMMAMQKFHILIPTLKAVAGLFTTMAVGEEEMLLAGGAGGKGAPGALEKLLGASASTGTGGLGLGGIAKKEERALVSEAETVGKTGFAARLTKPFDNLIGNLEKRYSAFLPENFAKYAARGTVVAGGGLAGYMGGTAIQGATGLRRGGTASALGGLAGTGAGVAAAAGIGALAGIELGPVGMLMGATLGSAVGTTFGPTIGHFFSSIFGGAPARNYGREFVREFNKALPGLKIASTVAIGPSGQKEMVKRIQDDKNAAGKAYADFQSAQDTYRSALAKPMMLGGVQITPSTERADLKAMNTSYDKYKKLADTSGTDTANYFISAMQAVKVPSEFAFQTDILTALGKLKGPAQQSALDTLLGYVQTLQQNKDLAPNQVQKILTAIEAQFPALKVYMQQQGEQDDAALAEKMKLKQTQTQLQTTMTTIETQFGLAWLNPDISGANWAKNVGKNASALQTIIKNSSGTTRTQAVTAYEGLQTDTGKHFQAMVDHTRTRMSTMKSLIEGHSKDAAATAKKHFGDLATSIDTAWKGGAISTTRGAQLISQATNTILKEFGAKSLSQIGLGNVQKLVEQFQSQSYGQVHLHQAGGLVQVGAAGQRGQDTIPMQVGGQPIMVGAGEQVAVFNAHQQAVMNTRLADYGGLPGFFSSVNTPHAKFQEGGFVPGFQQGGQVFRPGASGRFSYGQLEGLWERAGGASKMAPIMAAIALAESTGSPTAHNPSGASGLWQILGLPFPGDVWDPLTNAKMAVSKLRSQGLGAWATYTNHAYLQYLHGGVPAILAGGMGAAAPPTVRAPQVTGQGAIHGITQGALDKIAKQANTYILSASARSMMAQLPPGALPHFAIQAGPVPAQVQLALAAAKSQLGKPYISGGYGLTASGEDCSGYVSTVLNAAGLDPQGHLLTGGLKTWGEPGPGKYITVGVWGADSGPHGHTMMEINGQFFESGGGGGGPHIDKNWSMGFTWWRHPKGFARGGIVGEPGYQLTASEFAQLQRGDKSVLQKYKERGGLLFEEGGLVPGFQGGGGFNPHATAASVHPPTETGGGSHKGITTKKLHGGGSRNNPKKSVGHKPTRYPHPKGLKPIKIIPQMPASVAGPLATINADDSLVTKWQQELSIVQGREALWPVTAIISPIDPSNNLPEPAIVNWGNVKGMAPITAPPYTSIPAGPILQFPPGGVGTPNWGMTDPSTGQWAYGLDVRLGEIGPHLALGSRAVTDETTELGLNNLILAKWWEQVAQAPIVKKASQAEMNQLVQTIGWYDDQSNFHPGLVQQWIDRMKQQRALIAPNKSDIATKLKDRYQKLKNKVRQESRNKRLKGQLLRAITVDDLTKLQANMDAAIPGKAPYNWVAAGMGNPKTGQANADYLWGTQERPKEIAGVTDYITTLRDQANTAAMKLYYTITLDTETAVQALQYQEDQARQELYDKAAHKRIDLDQLITTKTQLVTKNKKILDALSGQTAYSKQETVGGIIGQMNQIIDPAGQLQAVNIDTMRYITIPTLTNEINQILQTQPTQNTSGDQSALADAQNLMNLQSQRMVIQAEALASQASGFKILTDALRTMPPFAGSFQEGGVVPGPLGEARTIIAHGGETVTPAAQPSQSQQPMRMLIRMEDNTTRVWLDDVEQQVQMSTSTAARHARRGLPGRAGGLVSQR